MAFDYVQDDLPRFGEKEKIYIYIFGHPQINTLVMSLENRQNILNFRISG